MTYQWKRTFQELRDPRYFQIIYLFAFLVYGIYSLGWHANILKYSLVIGSALTTQYVCLRVTRKSPGSLKSALITALGLSLLLHADKPWVFVLAGVLAIAGKFIIKIGNKHLFNPANFGIIAAITLTGEAWISPGQWGSSAILLYFMGAAGLMVILNVGRIDTSLAFLGTYSLLLLGRDVLYLGWEPEVVAHKLTNGSLLLFTFFMITDPMTIPNHRKGRIIWSVLVAVAVFLVSTRFYVQTAAIWVLFFVTPVTVLIDKIFKARKFEWHFGLSMKRLTNSENTQP